MSTPVMVARSRVARASRRGSDPAELKAARQALAAAKIETVIRGSLTAAPPLSGEQRAALVELLFAGGGSR